MKPKMYLIAVVVALLVAIPLTAISSQHTKQLKIERDKQHNLQLKIDSTEKQLQKQQDELDRKDDTNDKLKKENEQLKKDLQAKAEAKRQAQVAAAQQQVSKPAVSASLPVGCEHYRDLVQRYFGSQTDNAMLTMQKESGCNPQALSSTADRGLFQINQVHSAKVGGNLAALYDPETNVRIAKQIYDGRGWTAWYAVQGILW